MDVVRLVDDFIHRHRLLDKAKPLLVAVSGGVDSVVLLDVLLRLGYRCHVAHCNFQLRGAASESDAAFVAALAEQHGTPLYTTLFSTQEYACENKLSVEMAARELRYRWFDDLCHRHHLQSVAVAHHANDNAETVLLNLSRGTGLQGIIGMQPKRGMVVRPLLGLSRPTIERYATEKRLKWCIDATNSDTDIQRNFIRHRIIPAFCTVNPSFVRTMQANILHFNEAAQLYRWSIDALLPTIVTHADNDIHYINTPALLAAPAPETLLFEILQPYNFGSHTVEQLFEKLLLAKSGRQFFSSTHRVVVHACQVIITPLAPTVAEEYYFSADETMIEHPVCLRMERITITSDFVPNNSPLIACLDADRLTFPLQLRRWQQADSFCPLGMNRKKKLSDFFVDNKLDIIRKENVWLLVSGGEIVWIIGLRIDNRFRITPATKCVLRITVEKEMSKSFPK
jgi:tRNA(Ile)-lysidine synthase